MTSPFFSVMLPAKGRPNLVRDALQSILLQDFADFEVLLSNNGADPDVKAAIADLLADPRVRYIEQAEVLNMPAHWEAVSKLARGRYFTVLPDRSVLMQGALEHIRRTHDQFRHQGEIISWSWDLYFEDAGLLMAASLPQAPAAVELDSDETVLASISGASEYPYSLPRGLNSSVRTSLLQEIRAICGTAFGALSPDFTFAYQCLLLRKSFVHINKALMISQGLSISNGGNSLRGDLRPYFAQIGVSEPFVHAPSKAMLVENGIAEDFLRSAHIFKRNDLLASWDRKSYYLKCFRELDGKRRAAIVPASYIDSLESEMQAALEKETPEIIAAVKIESRSVLTSVRQTIARMIGPGRVAALRPLIQRMRGARRYPSVLRAANFENPS